MKLIIDIPELDYECAKQRWARGNNAHTMDYYISKGIPVDDVKAEIEQGYCIANNDYDKGRNYGLYMVTQILDNIGKAKARYIHKMSKYFKPYNTEEDPTYPEDVRYIRNEVENKYGKFDCSNRKIGELWRDFSETWCAGFLSPNDDIIERFVKWLEDQE